MKEKLINNLGIKLLSLVLASILWVVIMNIDDPIKTRQFSSAQVEILNESDIQSLDKVYDIVEGATVDITVRGRRSIIDSLKSTDIKATANLSNRYITDASGKTLNVHIDAYCTKYTESVVDVRITGAAQVLKISLEDVNTKQFKVNIQQNGEVADGFAVGEITPKPNMMEVTGAKSQISKIAEVRVDVDVSGASDDFKVKLKPRVFDENGSEIDSSKLKFSSAEIVTTVKLIKTKTIPVYMKITGKAADGYQYVDMDYEPKQLEVAANSATLKDLESCTVLVNITGATGDVEKSIEFAKYLPKNVKVVGDIQTITVKVTVKKMITKEFTVSPNDIQVKNIPEGMQFNYLDSKDSIIVKVMGLEKDLSTLTKETLGAFIDLSDLEPGTHNVSIQLTLSDKFVLATNPIISVELTKAGTPKTDTTVTPSTSPTPSPTPEVNSDIQ